MASRAAQRAIQKQVRWPAPLGGLNLNSSVMAMPATDAYVLDNFVIRTFGIEMRKGWRFWLDTETTGLSPPQPQWKSDGLPHGVGTLLAYNAPNAANNKLFACTEAPAGAIFDVTSAGVTPVVPALVPTSPPNVAGEWYGMMYLTPGGSFMCTVSAGAGYYVYNGTTWVEYVNGGGPTNISFPVGDTTTTKQFCNVFVWKNRLWFLKANSSRAYYLPTNQISGSVQPFDFGALMPHGGNLDVGINWTYDGGAGVDDFLVILGGNGDMLIYQGTDPAQLSSFNLRGVWYVGRLPPGRRGWSLLGGDVVFVTEYGIHGVSDYVSGRITDPQQQSSYATKINPTVARQVSDSLTLKYWFVLPYPKEEQLVLGTPFTRVESGVRISYSMSSLSRAWSTLADMDMKCGVIFNGDFYFGTKNGDVCQGFFGAYDGASVDGNLSGTEITSRSQGAFLDYGSPSVNKRMTRVKILGLANGQPSYRIVARSEYDFLTSISAPAPVAQPGSLWDAALWDLGVWSQSQQTFGGWFGVAGFGKKLSTLISIRSNGGTVITDLEATYLEGNGL